jgi:hypothetical protein
MVDEILTCIADEILIKAIDQNPPYEIFIRNVKISLFEKILQHVRDVLASKSELG